MHMLYYKLTGRRRMIKQERNSWAEIQERFNALQAQSQSINLKNAYKKREDAIADKNSFNKLQKETMIMKTMIDLYKEYSKKGVEVDIFTEPPFENCSMLGYEKQYVKIDYSAFKVKKDKVLTSVQVKGTVSTISNSIQTHEYGNYTDYFYLAEAQKSVKQAYYVRRRKPSEEANVELSYDDNLVNYVDVNCFNKSTEKTKGYIFYKVSQFINRISLLAGMLCLLFMFIGNNYIIGQCLAYGKTTELGELFLKIFNTPFEIAALACLGLYLVSSIMKMCSVKHYNNLVSSAEFAKMENIYAIALKTALTIIAFLVAIYTNAMNYCYVQAVYEPYNNYQSLFSGFPLVDKFAEVCARPESYQYAFDNFGQASIFLGGISISLTGLLIPVLVIVKTVFVAFDFKRLYEVEGKLIKRKEFVDSKKKQQNIEKKFKAINESLITFDSRSRSRQVYKYVPAVFDSNSEIIESQKTNRIKNGKFNFGMLFYAIALVFIPLLTFLIYDSVTDLCALKTITWFGKLCLYWVVLSGASAVLTFAVKFSLNKNKLDD